MSPTFDPTDHEDAREERAEEQRALLGVPREFRLPLVEVNILRVASTGLGASQPIAGVLVVEAEWLARSLSLPALGTYHADSSMRYDIMIVEGPSIAGGTYVQRLRRQLVEWIGGSSMHNLVSGIAALPGGECCPDFSCCRPENAVPLGVRRLFARSDDRQRGRMLGSMLANLIRNEPTSGDQEVIGP